MRLRENLRIRHGRVEKSALMPSFNQGEPPAGERLELLCEDHNGTYVLPFPCRWLEGSWRNATSGHLVEADVLGWRPREGQSR